MKALFVGLGSIGQRHLRNLKKLRPDIELIAVRSSRSTPVLSNTNQIIKQITNQIDITKRNISFYIKNPPRSGDRKHR